MIAVRFPYVHIFRRNYIALRRFRYRIQPGPVCSVIGSVKHRPVTSFMIFSVVVISWRITYCIETVYFPKINLHITVSNAVKICAQIIIHCFCRPFGCIVVPWSAAVYHICRQRNFCNGCVFVLAFIVSHAVNHKRCNRICL